MNRYFILFVLLFSVITLFFNVSNDFQENLSYNFKDLSDEGSIVLKGWLFFNFVAFFSFIFSTKIVIYSLYIITPVSLTYLSINFFKKSVVFFFYFFFIIIFGQSAYLLKMCLSQTIILLFLFKPKYRFLSISSILIHLQAIPIVSLLFFKVNRLLFISVLALCIYWISKNELLSAGDDILLAYGGLNSENLNYNKISFILVSIYILCSVIKSNDKSRLLILTKLIDTILISCFLFLSNEIILNRLLDFCWVFILIYLFCILDDFNSGFRIVIHIALVCCSFLSIYFYFNYILGFAL